MIAEEKILEIRSRSSIVEIVSDHLALKKVGRNYVGLCPFHGEKTPSFTVNEEKGIFHCFGCGAGGDVFHFLMRHDHLTFPEAVERVGKRYGILVESADRRGDGEGREALYDLNEKAAAFFHRALFHHPEGKRALDYLRSRGIEERSARTFRLGYAPQAGQEFLAFLRREGISLKSALRLGLISEKGPEHYADKFSGRLIFPIFNAGGKIVGFGARVIGEGWPKYLNSAETPLFRKAQHLYGLFHARQAIGEADRVIVVEGYLDVVALHQSGIVYAVATLGTALTADHVRALGRYTKNIIALFDGDDAGRKAAARSFEIFVEGGLFGRAAFLPGGEDPDSFVRTRGKAALEQVIGEAVPLADYYLKFVEERYGRSLEAKSQIAREVSRLLGKVQNPLDADLLARRAVDFLGIREELLRSPSRASRRSNPPATPWPGAREDLAERSFVSLLLRFPSLLGRLEAERDFERLLSSEWSEVVKKIFSLWQARASLDSPLLTQKLPPERASEIAELILQAESLDERDGERMFEDCLFYLRRRYLRQLERDLRREIRSAEERSDEETKRERMLEWQEVVQRKRQLERQRLGAKREIL